MKAYHIKNNKRSMQSSRWLFEALAQLMEGKDYEEITVTDIVEKAKLGRTTFYRNFDTIDDILRMKCDEKFEELHTYIINYFRTNTNEPKPPFTKPYLRFWYIHSNIIELLIKAKRLDIFKDSLIKLIRSFSSYFPQIQNNAIIRGHINYFIEIRTSIAISVLVEWIKNDKNVAPD